MTKFLKSTLRAYGIALFIGILMTSAIALSVIFGSLGEVIRIHGQTAGFLDAAFYFIIGIISYFLFKVRRSDAISERNFQYSVKSVGFLVVLFLVHSPTSILQRNLPLLYSVTHIVICTTVGLISGALYYHYFVESENRRLKAVQ